MHEAGTNVTDGLFRARRVATIVFQGVDVFASHAAVTRRRRYVSFMAIRASEHERHDYAARLVWTGARDGPTRSYQSYSREHEVQSGDRPPLHLSADPHFRGDATLYNPEELLVISLSSCHLLSYLAECARGGVRVLAYEDDAAGVMTMREGKLRFAEVVLRPRVTVAPETNLDRARELHHRAHDDCYIANSVNFPVRHEPTIVVAEPARDLA